MRYCLNKVDELKSFFSKIKDALILLGGDIGSAVLAKIAKDSLGNNVIAVTINSPIVSPLRIYNASKLAAQIKISHVLINLNELQVENFTSSGSNRCLLCITYRYGMIKKIALEAGFSKIIDGSYIQENVFRQKQSICMKEGIFQPFIELGFNQADVLKLHKLVGLKSPQHIPKCIAAKIPYNTEITLNKIKCIRLIEAYLRKRYRIYADAYYDGENLVLDVKATTSYGIKKSEITSSIMKTFRNANIKKVEWILPE
jgi:uncharacterized protein